MTVQEYAEAHGVAESTVRRWCSRGKLDAEKIQSENQPWKQVWMIQDGEAEAQPESPPQEEDQPVLSQAPRETGETARFHVEPRGRVYRPKEAVCQEEETATDEDVSRREPPQSWNTEEEALEERKPGTGTGWMLVGALAVAVVLWRSPISGGR